ncbi:hypothetical protein H5410_025146 [Solanum commersonii]|uniref:Uncharacterized protein n=1 Tax=Solanum commersonii TaxID=4109 RepID=A0A9J5YXP6_SOLCO|nr:hypothetical protein H5410_025146 [Solanum commersonii]
MRSSTPPPFVDDEVDFLQNNGVFDMLDIDAKYHRQRYATIIWHYGKTKNDDGDRESEVCC